MAVLGSRHASTKLLFNERAPPADWRISPLWISNPMKFKEIIFKTLLWTDAAVFC